MIDPFIIVDRAVKYPCSNRAEAEEKMKELAEAGVKKVILLRSETIDLTKFQGKLP